MSPAQTSLATGLPSYSARSQPKQPKGPSAANEFDRAACVGVFATLPQAEHAVRQLRAVGFSKQHIGVVCCEDLPSDRFATGPSQAEDSNSGVASIVGAALGALALIVSTTADGGTVLLGAGPASIASGATLGGLVGVMGLLGVQRDTAEQFRATIEDGAILVVVDRDDIADDGMLASAARILDEAGSVPLGTPIG